MSRIVIVIMLVLLPLVAAGQPCPAQWAGHPIVAGETPIKAAHVNELRACLRWMVDNWPGDDGTPIGMSVSDVRRRDDLPEPKVSFFWRRHVDLLLRMDVAFLRDGEYVAGCDVTWIDAIADLYAVRVNTHCGYPDGDWDAVSFGSIDADVCRGCGTYRLPPPLPEEVDP